VTLQLAGNQRITIALRLLLRPAECSRKYEEALGFGTQILVSCFQGGSGNVSNVPAVRTIVPSSGLGLSQRGVIGVDEEEVEGSGEMWRTTASHQRMWLVLLDYGTDKPHQPYKLQFIATVRDGSVFEGCGWMLVKMRTSRNYARKVPTKLQVQLMPCACASIRQWTQLRPVGTSVTLRVSRGREPLTSFHNCVQETRA